MRRPDGRTERPACTRLISCTPGRPRMHALPHGSGSTNGSTPLSLPWSRRVTLPLLERLADALGLRPTVSLSPAERRPA